ncbi:hypothetical protein SDC9_100397 [bioreactor metagenome]|uniref:Uncharacterized protein n=1 Tax=bioreactor metagenome TaxID=1076179 RepID=A0A645ALL8_9ZZZZ
MCTFLRNTPLIQNEDAIGIAYGGKALGNHEGGTVFSQLGKSLLNGAFCFRIHTGGRFIENQHFRFHEQGTSNRHALFLPTG